MRRFFHHKSLFYLANLLAGALLPLAFAPLELYPLAVLSPALAISLWYRSTTASQATIQGLMFGIGFFSIGVSWVYISIHVYGQTPAWIAGSLTALFILFLALFPAINAYVLRRCFPKMNINTLLLAFPSSWVILEWIRSWIFTGFPWLLIGNSQIIAPLSGLAPIMSVYGVSFAVILTAGLLVNALRGRRHLIYSIIALLVLWGISFALQYINWTKPTGKPLTASLIQGDIPQQLKWEPSQIISIMDEYQRLTNDHWNSNIIIWPEGAIPALYDQLKPMLSPTLVQAQKHHAALLIGTVSRENQHIYNTIMTAGNVEGVYYKRHLVPFGEYVPFEHWLRGLINFFNLPMSNLSPGQIYQPLMKVGSHPIATAICYEIAYLNELLHSLPKAELIVTISDDSWFGNSWGPYQHLEIAQMRSLETGRYQLVATNNGITAIIDPKGQIIQQIPRNKEDVLTGKIEMMQGDTPLIRTNLEPILIVIFLLFVIALLYRPNRNRERNLIK